MFSTILEMLQHTTPKDSPFRLNYNIYERAAIKRFMDTQIKVMEMAEDAPLTRTVIAHMEEKGQIAPKDHQRLTELAGMQASVMKPYFINLRDML